MRSCILACSVQENGQHFVRRSVVQLSTGIFICTSEAPWAQFSLDNLVGEDGGVSCENLEGVGDRVELWLVVCTRKPRIIVQLMRFSVILRLSNRRH